VVLDVPDRGHQSERATWRSGSLVWTALVTAHGPAVLTEESRRRVAISKTALQRASKVAVTM
jgi:hypothetical protein